MKTSSEHLPPSPPPPDRFYVLLNPAPPSLEKQLCARALPWMPYLNWLAAFEQGYTENRKSLLVFVFLNKSFQPIFFAFQMVTRPRPNLFEMLINLTSPQWLDRLDLLTRYIDTCGKKIQSEIIIQIKRCSAPHSKIGNFSCERWRRLLTKEKQDALV